MRKTLPAYRHQKSRNLAVVRLNGRDIYLGPYGSKTSRDRYDQVVREWLESGRTSAGQATGATVAEVIAGFVDAGMIKSHADAHKAVIALLLETYAETPAAEFGPLKLKVIRSAMVEKGWKRKTINDRIHVARRYFRWAAGNELIPAAVINALDTVPALREGETNAPESDPVEPVDPAYVARTIRHAPKPVQDIVALLQLTGMRPSELFRMRTCDLDTTADVWVYRPSSHKSKRKGKSRQIPIGPKAIEVLRPYLLIDLQAYIFSPALTIEYVFDQRAATRSTPAGQGNTHDPQRRAALKARLKPMYTAGALRKVIASACEKEFPPPPHLARKKGERSPAWMKRLTPAQREELRSWRAAHRWHPYQLRHTFGQTVRDLFGLEHQQPAMGHANAKTSEIYAAASLKKAVDVAAKIG